jgi:hypothetical protein
MSVDDVVAVPLSGRRVAVDRVVSGYRYLQDESPTAVTIGPGATTTGDKVA